MIYCHRSGHNTRWCKWWQFLKWRNGASLGVYRTLHMQCTMPSTCRIIHWGRVTHICVIKLTSIGSDNGLSPGQCRAIIWTNVGTLLIEPLGANFNEIVIEIHFHSRKSTWKFRLRNGGNFVREGWDNASLNVLIVNSSPLPGQNGTNITYDNIECNFVIENLWVSIFFTEVCYWIDDKSSLG